MLIPIPKETTKEYQSRINEVMVKAVPGYVPERIDLVMDSLSSGKATAWLIIFGEEIFGMVITKVFEDECLDLRELFVYCMCLTDGHNMSSEMWEESYMQLQPFAKAMGCSWITAHTVVDRVRKMSVKCGGSSDITYVRVPV